MLINKNVKLFLIISSIMMAINVMIGAFGAHGLKSYVDEYYLSVFQTGVTYSFYNTLGLFIISFLIAILPSSRKIVISAYLLLLGTLVFSCSLYALALVQTPLIGIITPIGGSIIIIAWLLCAYSLKDLKIERN